MDSALRAFSYVRNQNLQKRVLILVVMDSALRVNTFFS